MDKWRWSLRALGGVLAIAAVHCGSDADSSELGADNSGNVGGTGGFGGGAGGVGGSGGGGGAFPVDAGVSFDAGPPPPPPEEETESSFRSPVATGRYVWSTNPTSGRVALVDALTLEVETVEAGFAPTYLAGVPEAGNPEANQAIVLNVLSRDATFLRAEGAEVSTVTVEVHEGANAWSISESGRWAIAWSDSEQVEDPDTTEGFQDITVIDLAQTPARATRLTVGYRPVKLEISEDETRAFAVTEPGITVVELDDDLGPFVSHDVEVTVDAFDDPASRDVSITPDGTLALVRRVDQLAINVVALPIGDIVSVELPGFVTDLDISEDGTVAYAVTRFGDVSQMAILPLPEIFTDPSAAVVKQIPGETFGSVSVSPTGQTALLYTNAEANDHLTITRTADIARFVETRTVALKAPVDGVFVAPDAAHAVALMKPGSTSSKLGAFGVVPVAQQLPPKIQGTEARPFAVAIAPAPASTRAVVVTRDTAKKVFNAYLVRMPELQVDRIPLSSRPLAAGIVAAANRAYVAQDHPEGRITFIDLDDGSVRTLTGFELDSKVVDGS